MTGMARFVNEYVAPGQKIGALEYRTLTSVLRCSRCGGGLPVQGPLRTVVRCSHCQRENELERSKLVAYLDTAARGMESGSIDLTYSDRGHPCPGCDEPISLGRFALDAESSVVCRHCGVSVASFPPPPWLKEQLPGLVLLIGADRDPGDSPDGEPVAPPAAAREPVVLSCPTCAGSLAVTEETKRTLKCEFCQANVFIPDDLWRSLHPVKVAAFWTFAFEGPKLRTLGDVRYEERVERHREQEELERKEREAVRLLEEVDEADRLAASQRKTAIIGWLSLLVSGLVAAFAIWKWG